VRVREREKPPGQAAVQKTKRGPRTQSRVKIIAEPSAPGRAQETQAYRKCTSRRAGSRKSKMQVIPEKRVNSSAENSRQVQKTQKMHLENYSRQKRKTSRQSR